MDASKKFVVMGLDNSGKTTIVHSLKGDVNLLSLCSFKPTVDYAIETITTEMGEFKIWDFGGQDRYRLKHLEHLPDNLARASKIIFVIDIQDAARQVEALGFLKRVVDSIEDPAVELSIFLHKSDPTLKGPIDDTLDSTIAGLVERVREIVPPSVSCKIFKTSVYTVFHKVPVST